MSRSTYSGPRLPKALLDQVHEGRVSKNDRRSNSRKERRAAERAQKKTGSRLKQAYSHISASEQQTEDPEPGYSEDDGNQPPRSLKPVEKPKKPKTKVKAVKFASPEPLSDESDDDEAEPYESAPVVSKTVSSRLKEDDEEIAALEKKLGIKGKKSKALADDGLSWLVDDLEGEGDESGSAGKRKRLEDEKWLSKKRSRAQAKVAPEVPAEESSSDGMERDEDEWDGDSDAFSSNGFSENEFNGFESDGASEPQPMPGLKKARENPYVAPPVESGATAKYIPPSLRKSSPSDEAESRQLRRQLQGLLNRLSEANILSIVQTVERTYSANARQYVTNALVDLLIGLIADPAVLNDTFLILHAAFAGALYKVVGVDFGAHLLEASVRAFDRFHQDDSAEGKQTLNLVAFLVNLYSLQIIGSKVVFDYIRLLLHSISEANTELLLRVIRISGTQLRQDDPTSLKDIVLLLQRATAKVEKDSLSVRTRFMIETIQDLKNNRVRTGLAASALVTEHMQRMKRTLGSLNSRAKASEPLNISLADIQNAEKKGKWWLVGASYKDPAKMANAGSNTSDRYVAAPPDAPEDASDASDDVDLDRLARAQGMNTDVRRAIFVAIAGAVDYKHAHMRLVKLNLRNKQLVEIPRVLLHCVGAEASYNHYYTVIAREFCGDHKLRKAYHFVLLDLFKRMGEGRGEGEGEGAGDSDDESGVSELTVRKIYNLAKMYATLIADGLLRLTILKTLDFSSLESKTQVFVEVLFVTIMVLLRRKGRDAFEASIKTVFQAVHAVPDMVTGLKYYVSTILASTEIASSKKEMKVIVTGCDYAVQALMEAPSVTTGLREESSEAEDDAWGLA